LPQDIGVKLGEKFGADLGLKGRPLERIVRIVESLFRGEKLSTLQLSARLGEPLRTVAGDLKLLREEGLIVFSGAKKTGHYQLTRTGKALVRQILS
jgi:Mn-dependent DtxR family transcriptional regulator